MNKWMKKLTAALCAAVLMCGMAVTAYAGGGEEWDGLDPVEPLPAETVDPGEGFTEDGNLVCTTSERSVLSSRLFTRKRES